MKPSVDTPTPVPKQTAGLTRVEARRIVVLGLNKRSGIPSRLVSEVPDGPPSVHTVPIREGPEPSQRPRIVTTAGQETPVDKDTVVEIGDTPLVLAPMAASVLDVRPGIVLGPSPPTVPMPGIPLVPRSGC